MAGSDRPIMMDAVERAQEMMKTKMGDLPDLALDYVSHVSSKIGICGEVFLMCFAHYAQYVEGLSCNSSDYMIDDKGKKWFKKQGVECKIQEYEKSETTLSEATEMLSDILKRLTVLENKVDTLTNFRQI